MRKEKENEKSVRFLSWEYWDFLRRQDHFRRFSKKSEVFRRSRKSSEDAFLRAIFFRPFRLSLAPTICPWVSEDGKQPPLISDHPVFAFWLVAYGRFECRSKMMSTIGMFQGAEKVQKGTNFRFWVWSFGVLYPGQPTSIFSREI